MHHGIAAREEVAKTDRLGNPLAPSLPYARGSVIRSTEDDYRKLRRAWRIIAQRFAQAGPNSTFNFSGLERGDPVDPSMSWLVDDDLAPAFCLDRLVELSLQHLGGVAAEHDIAVFNRMTAAIFASHLVLVGRGDTVVGVSASHSHPSVSRAAERVGGRFVDTTGYAAFERAMNMNENVPLVVLTRLAVTYDSLPIEQIRRIIDLAHQRGALVFVDDAGGARVGPAIFDQPRMLELGVDLGATGLDKYGTIGPRLGLLGGRRDLVNQIRARGFEFGLEARPMLYAAVVRSLEQYDPERVRKLVATANAITAALKGRLGSRIRENGLIGELQAEDILEVAVERSGGRLAQVVPYEATAALAMLLLREYGIITVHFAGVPPGTSSILFKFVPPETLERFGGVARFAAAVDDALDKLAQIIGSEDQVRRLLFGSGDLDGEGATRRLDTRHLT